jgi:hypothetical protein
MPMFFSNDQQVTSALEKVSDLIIDYLAPIIVDEIQSSIDENVYELYEPEMYHRRGHEEGFAGSWTYQYEDDGTLIFFSNPDDMELNNEESVHGDPLTDEGEKDSNGDMHYYAREPDIDNRAIMDIILQEGVDHSYWGDYLRNKATGTFEGQKYWWEEPRDYWNPVIDDLIRKNSIGRRIDFILARNGIIYKKMELS